MSLFPRLRHWLRCRIEHWVKTEMAGRIALSAVVATSAATFVDSIGINTHLGRTTGIYAHPGMPDMLGSLGIKHVRDNTGNTTAVSRLSYVYTTYGINTTMVVDWTPLSIDQRVQWLSQDWAECIEGLNEPSHQTRDYRGFKDTTYPSVTQLATRQYQFDLYNAVKANPSTMNKPVLSPAQAFSVFAPTLGDLPFDVLAFHRYAGGTSYPGSMNLDAEDFKDLAAIGHTGTEPLWMTETGYQTCEQGVHPRLGVSDTAQAKYLPRNIAEAFLEGVDRVYLYELADEGDDETDAEDHFGIVAYQPDSQQPLSLKPAGQTVKRLINHLNDSQPGSFTPGSLDFTIDAGSADISNLHYLLLQENDTAHTYSLLLWQEVLSYDAANHLEINNPALNVTVRFNQSIATAKVYNLNSDSIQASYTNPKGLTLSVPDEIVLVQLTTGTTVPGGTLPIVEVTATDPVAVENGGDNGRFTFTRSGGDISQPLTIWVEILGEAVNGTDYQSINNAVTFAAGSTTAYKDIAPLNDAVAEGDEQVVLRIWGNTGVHTVGLKWSASVHITDDEAQSDLTITDIAWSPALPQPGDAVTFLVTVMNQGTRATVGNASLYVQPGYDWGTRLYSSVASGLAAGNATVVTLPGTWTAQPGFSEPKSGIDYTSVVFETNEDNNYRSELLAIPFATRKDDFQAGLDTTAWTGWDVTGNWAPVTYSSNTVLENQDVTSAYASPVTTYLPTNFASQWSSEFDYDWRWGGSPSVGYGAYSLIITQDLLDDAGNGYRIVVRQGDGNNSNYVNKVIQIFQIDDGVVASTPLAEGAGYDQCGFKSVGLSTPRLKRIKVDYDQVAGKISVYGDADGDGQLELFTQAQGTLPYDRITHITMNTNTTATCGPVLDHVRLNLYNPLDSVVDNFNANTAGNAPANWYAAGNWKAASFAGNIVIENQDTASGGRYIAKGWSLPYDAAWRISMDYDWKWGGNISPAYGYYYMYSYLDILDDTGTGYRLKIHQGDSNTPSNQDKVLELYRRDNWSTLTLLGSSAGYNEAGWASRGLSGPILKRIAYEYEPSTQTLSIYADPDGDGQLNLMLQVSDLGTPHQNLTKVYIGAEGFSASERFTLDNVRVDQLHIRDLDE